MFLSARVTGLSGSLYSTYPNLNSSATMYITADESISGPIYIDLRLKYGLVDTDSWSQSAKNTARYDNSFLELPDFHEYRFAVCEPHGLLFEERLQSTNRFTCDTTFTGQVTKSNGNPVANVIVQIYDAYGRLIGTTNTNKRGWYTMNIKDCDKDMYLTFKLPYYKLEQQVYTGYTPVVKPDFHLPISKVQKSRK